MTKFWHAKEVKDESHYPKALSYSFLSFFSMKQVTWIQKKVAISLSLTFTEGEKKTSESMPEVTGILITQTPMNNSEMGRRSKRRKRLMENRTRQHKKELKSLFSYL